MVCAGHIGQIVAEPLAAAGRPAGKPAATPLIDFECRNARTIERGRAINPAVAEARRAMQNDHRWDFNGCVHVVRRTFASAQSKASGLKVALPIFTLIAPALLIRDHLDQVVKVYGLLCGYFFTRSIA